MSTRLGRYDARRMDDSHVELRMSEVFLRGRRLAITLVTSDTVGQVITLSAPEALCLAAALKAWAVEQPKELRFRVRVLRDPRPAALLDEVVGSFEEAQARVRAYFDGSEEKNLSFNISPEEP